MLKRIPATFALFAVLAACSGGDDPATEPTPSATSEPTQTSAPSVNGELCDVIDPAMSERLADGDTPAPALMLGSEVFVGCDVTSSSSFEYGVRVIDDGTELADYLSGEAEPVDDLGEEAYRTGSGPGGSAGETIVARDGDRVVYVRNELLFNGPDRATSDDTLAVAQLLLDLPQADVDALEPVAVSAPCPDAAAIEEAAGEPVVLARGSITGNSGTCLYRLEGGGRAYLSYVNQDNAANDFVSVEPGISEELELEGAQVASIAEEPTSVTVEAAPSDDVSWYIEIIASSSDGVDRDAVISLAESLLAAS